jgi:hypothetical protein
MHQGCRERQHPACKKEHQQSTTTPSGGRPAAGSRSASKSGEAVLAAGVPPRQEPEVPLRSEQAQEAAARDSCNMLATKP